MKFSPTSPARYVNLLIHHLEQQGIDCSPAVAAVGLDRQALAHPQAQMAQSRVIDVFREVAALGGVQSDVGLVIGKMITLGALGDLGRAMLVCATPREAMACCAEFLSLIAPSYGLQLVPGPTHGEFRYYPVRSSPYEMTRIGFDIVVGGFDNLIGFLRPDVPTTYDVYFAYPAPPHEQSYRKLTRARCHFNEPGLPSVRIVVANEALDVPMPMHSPGELAELRQRLQIRMQSVPGHGSWMEWVSMMLRDSDGVQPTQEQVGAVAGLSAATLARYLAAEGTSFRALANDIRHQKACQWLQEGQLSVTHIAQRLGYDNPANFVRAFKARRGCAPTEYARAQAAGTLLHTPHGQAP